MVLRFHATTQRISNAASFHRCERCVKKNVFTIFFNVLNSKPGVQECDATKANGNSAAGYQRNF